MDRPAPPRTPFAYTPPPTEAADRAFTTGRPPVSVLELAVVTAAIVIAALALLTGGGLI